MTPPGASGLLFAAAVAVIGLVVLITRFRLNPFLALVLVSLLLGLAIGMPPGEIIQAYEAGVGRTLGHIALVVGLGAVLGKMMVESGGAERIARTLVTAFGPKRVDWAMVVVAFLVGLPVFFEVGFVLLVPIVLTVARRTGTPLIRVGLPMAAGLSVVHGLVPPHPAALLAVTAYGADIGRTIVAALIVGLPTAAIAGPLLARLVGRGITSAFDTADVEEAMPAHRETALPSFAATVGVLLLPVFLMLLGSAAGRIVAARSSLLGLLQLIGSPVAALLIAVLISFWSLGAKRGFDRQTILAFTNQCLAPTAVVTLVVGAGAGFGRILIDGGVSDAIIGAAGRAHVPVLLLGWLIAALLRVATGSATVAMATASGIVAPIAAATAGVHPELLVLATGAGSLVLSHVNDGGFWLVKEFFGLTVPQTLRTWTVCETVISVVALGFTALLSLAMG